MSLPVSDENGEQPLRLRSTEFERLTINMQRETAEHPEFCLIGHTPSLSHSRRRALADASPALQAVCKFSA